MVNVGIKSRPGISSSTKLKIPPKKPFEPPNVLKKIKADIGAQMRSKNSPKKGRAYVAYPRKSISRQNANEGFFCEVAEAATSFFQNNFFMSCADVQFESTLLRRSFYTKGPS